VTTPRTHCIRCGECCLRSSPSIQTADLSLVYEGPIERSKLYTLRVGELVRDNLRGELTVSNQELIKIREREEGGGCIFYDDEQKACTIYENRPIQCRALACWDEREFMRVYARPKADRRDLYRDRVLLEIMAEHEKRCNYRELEQKVRRIPAEGEPAVEEVIELLRFDHNLRLLIPRKVNMDPAEMDLLLGRPLTETITMFGLQVIPQPEGGFFLTTLEAPEPKKET